MRTLSDLALARGKERGVFPDGYAVGYLGSLLISVETHLRDGKPDLAIGALDAARKGLEASQ